MATSLRRSDRALRLLGAAHGVLPRAGLAAAATGGLGLLLAGLAIAARAGGEGHDVLLLALTMAASGLGSLALAIVLVRLAEQTPRIGLAARLLIPGALAIVVVSVNVWFTASMMFISHKDSIVLAVLLGYAAVLAVAASSALAGSITSGLARLTDAVQRMAGGELGVRVPVRTADEIGALGEAFNQMAGQLAQAERLRLEMETARRHLLAAVSHDLRTPLSAIRVMLEAIEDGVVDDAETIERYHHAMQGEVARLSGLIDDLFELSQIEAGVVGLRRERADIGDLITETAEAMRAEAERAGVRLCSEFSEALPPISVDMQKLHRVLGNLLANAVRHTPAGGSVRLGAAADAATLAIVVADSGEGIAAEDLPHVFERFYRGDKSRSRAGGGAGLGLAIARGLVQAHGGQIDVQSTPGAGATFTVRLPLDSAAG
ncbi:MAG TPA: ATP-binding protein [Dehalococcoidia bacterium]|nr:ATP-binding protein [Dehalococcoidia bacterium]